MMKSSPKIIAVMLGAILLSACSGGSHQDLQRFVDETKRRPSGRIEPLPPFVPYENFLYSAMTLRSPFVVPLEEALEVVVGRRSNVEPNLNREKEYLEGFNLASLAMVGALEKDGTQWALINDGEGGIHRVTDGNFIGKNHGEIVATSNQKIDIIEIVPNGTNGWVERPKALQLEEKE
jgi:type IV pilus assembly protein PilP